jgi:tRNA/tmRNA/rRNA uracil-C5-methylase (TrmA/RlmC/RlmD family)
VVDDVSFQIQDIWNQKRAIVREILGEETLLREMEPILTHDRSRLDLMFYQKKIGMRGPKKSADPWDFDFSEELPEWSLNRDLIEAIRELRENPPPIEGAQLRFRVSPQKVKGLWFDTSKELLTKLIEDHSAYLDQLKKNSWIVELGHKDEQAPLHSWIPTYSKDNEEINLEFSISSFSQPGPEANRALIAMGMELMDGVSGINNWTELGSGYGNLSIAFSTLLGAPRALVETEAKAVRALKLNFDQHLKFLKSDSVNIVNASAESFQSDIANCEFLLADPPRSGFSEFFKKDTLKAQRILLYSCDLKGLIKDAEILKQNYKLVKWSVADVFPATPYVEVASLWERNK